jgi:hypothetical protein
MQEMKLSIPRSPDGDLQRAPRRLSSSLKPPEVLDWESSTMMNICPNPVRWNAVYEALMLECSRRGIPSAPPRPLILAGWAYSNDVEKADCWKATIDWAEQYGISEITRIEPKDWYCVDHPSSLEIGPFGGPTFLPWRFEPAEPPNADDVRLALAKLVACWPQAAGILAEFTHPSRITGKKSRRLVVLLSRPAPPPPWGDWNRLATDESRRAFTQFRRAVNAITSPVEFDHIDFEKQR